MPVDPIVEERSIAAPHRVLNQRDGGIPAGVLDDGDAGGIQMRKAPFQQINDLDVIVRQAVADENDALGATQALLGLIVLEMGRCDQERSQLRFADGRRGTVRRIELLQSEPRTSKRLAYDLQVTALLRRANREACARQAMEPVSEPWSFRSKPNREDPSL